MGKWKPQNIVLQESHLYRKDLAEADSPPTFTEAGAGEFRRDLTFDYQPRVPEGLLEDLGVKVAHQIDAQTSCLIARYNNAPIGCELFNLQGRARLSGPFRCEIRFPQGHVYGFALFVKQEFRGKGMAKLLNIEADKIMRGHFRYMDVLIETGNLISIRNSESLGFRRVKTVVFLKFFGWNFLINLNNEMQYNLYANILVMLKAVVKPVLIAPPAILKKTVQTMRAVKDELRLTSYSCEGEQADSGAGGVFICKHVPDAALLNRIYPGGFRVRKNRTFFRWKLFPELRAAAKEADFFVADVRCRHVNRLLPRLQGVWFIPKWVNQKNVSFNDFADFAKTRNRNAYSDIQKAKKYPYDYEFTKDEVLFQFFYEKMYHPYMQNRYSGEERVVTPFGALKEEFKKGGLLLVKDKETGRYLSGSVVHRSKTALSPVKIGLLNGDAALLQKEALTALYIAYFKFMEENKMSAIDLGLSRGFLNDGVLKYKAKWGTTVGFDKKRGNVFIFRICRRSPLLDNFLLNNPFISLEEGGLFGNVFLKEPSTGADREELVKTYRFKGLAETRLVGLNALENK